MKVKKDILDFDIDSLYFDAPMEAGIEEMITEAGNCYGTEGAERLLLKAYLLAPDNLTVIVALYRYYYYQHQLSDALIIAEKAMTVAGQSIDLPEEWARITAEQLGAGAFRSVGLVRFYLLSLKAYGIVNIRLGDIEGGLKAIRKVCSLDPRDHLKAKDFLELIENKVASEELVETESPQAVAMASA
jgi:tetratricopeptide (TPR) repeat protein